MTSQYRLEMKSYLEKAGAARDGAIELRRRQQIQSCIRKLIPEGWTMVISEASILIHRLQNPFPCIKVTYRGRIIHDYGKRLDPVSDSVRYTTEGELLNSVKEMIDMHRPN